MVFFSSSVVLFWLCALCHTLISFGNHCFIACNLCLTASRYLAPFGTNMRGANTFLKHKYNTRIWNILYDRFPSVFLTFSSNKHWWRLRAFSSFGRQTREHRLARPQKGWLRQLATPLGIVFVSLAYFMKVWNCETFVCAFFLELCKNNKKLSFPHFYTAF